MSSLWSLEPKPFLTKTARIPLSQMWLYQVSLDTRVNSTITAWFRINGSLMVWHFTAPYGVCCLSLNLDTNQLSPFLLHRGISLFFPSESAVFHFQCSTAFTTHFLLFWCQPWDCVYSARRLGVRNGCVRRGGRGRTWPANHKTLMTPWLSCGHCRKWDKNCRNGYKDGYHIKYSKTASLCCDQWQC